MMNLIGAIILNIFILVQIPEMKITDKAVVDALEKSIDLLNSKNSHLNVKYHLQVRIEDLGSSKLIYISPVFFISSFKEGLPHKYSIIDNRIVFIYEGNNSSNGNMSFEEFQIQFGKELQNDLKPDKSIYSSLNPNNIDYYSFQVDTYRFVIDDNSIKSSKKVCRFPDTRFYQLGYKYDENGDMMYEDGVFHPCSLKNLKEYCNYSPLEYFESEGLSIESKYNITAWVTIGKNGYVIKASIIDTQNILTEELKRKYEKIILEMPRWNKARLKGKKVSYRVNLGL